MSSIIGRRLRTKNPAACTVALAIAVFMSSLPMRDLCCVPSSQCCAGKLASQETERLEMRAPIPDCCQSIVRNEMPALKERLGARPDAPQPGAVGVIAPLTRDLL